MQQTPPRIHIELVPVWVHIKNLRHFVREFCLGMALLPETADQVAMATSELLENATKYASTPWVWYDLRLTGSHVEICVINRAGSEQRRLVLDFVAQIGQGDPLEAYLQCLERQTTHGQSQSGLARIRYEAAAEISATERGEEICMTARIPL